MLKLSNFIYGHANFHVLISIEAQIPSAMTGVQKSSAVRASVRLSIEPPSHASNINTAEALSRPNEAALVLQHQTRHPWLVSIKNSFGSPISLPLKKPSKNVLTSHP